MLEADIGVFFDRLDRTTLEERLGMQGADGSLRRLIGMCGHVGEQVWA